MEFYENDDFVNGHGFGNDFLCQPDLLLGNEVDVQNNEELQFEAPLSPTSLKVKDLEMTIMNCFSAMSQQVALLEQKVLSIQDFISTQTTLGRDIEQLSQASPQSSYISPSPQASPQQQQHQSPQFQQQQLKQQQHQSPQFQPQYSSTLKLQVHSMENKWYTERPFPTFAVSIVDSQTGQLYTNTNGWKIQVSLIDGNGLVVNDRADEKGLKQHVIKGTCEVVGFKFKQVSSKNGGHFCLRFEVLTAGENIHVERAESGEIVVMSARLFAHRKKSEISAFDSIAVMSGIGKQYQQRFAAEGIHTISDLSAIPIGESGRAHRLEILGRVQKEKGSLNDARFVDLIIKAQNIVSSQSKEISDDEPAYQPNPFMRSITNPSEQLSGIHEEEVGGYLNYSDSEEEKVTNSYIPSVAYRTASGSGNNLTRSNTITREILGPSVRYPAHTAALMGINVCKKIVNSLMNGHESLLDEKNDLGFTPLMIACYYGRADVVSYLCSLKEEVSPSSVSTGQRWTALHFATFGRNVECVKTILSCSKVNPAAQTTFGWTPLMIAILLGDMNLVDLLIHTISNKYQHIVSDMGLLHLCALAGNIEIFEKVASKVEGGLNSSIENELTSISSSITTTTTTTSTSSSSNTSNSTKTSHISDAKSPSLLHCAAFSGNGKMVRYLLEKKCQPKITFGGGWNALHVAASRGNIECVRALCEVVGPLLDVNAKTSDEWTALSLTCMSDRLQGAHPGQCAEELIKAGAIDTGSKLSATCVSVICSNLSALTSLVSSLGNPVTILPPPSKRTKTENGEDNGNDNDNDKNKDKESNGETKSLALQLAKKLGESEMVKLLQQEKSLA